MHYKVDFNSMHWESPMDGMRQKIQTLTDRQARLVEYTKDLAPHWCEKGHTGYVLQGQMEVRFEHETELYSPGDCIVIPGGQAHRHMARVLTDTVRVFFIEDI